METFEIKIKHPKPLSPIFDSMIEESVKHLIYMHNNLKKSRDLGMVMVRDYLPVCSLKHFDRESLTIELKVNKYHGKFLPAIIKKLTDKINRMARSSTLEV